MSTRGGGRSINLWWGVTGSNGVCGSLAAIGFLGRYNSCRIWWIDDAIVTVGEEDFPICMRAWRAQGRKQRRRPQGRKKRKLCGCWAWIHIMGTGARKVFGRGKRTVEMIETFSSILFFLLSENFLSLWYYQMWFMRGLKGCFRWKVLSIILILYNVNVNRYNILKYQI